MKLIIYEFIHYSGQQLLYVFFSVSSVPLHVIYKRFNPSPKPKTKLTNLYEKLTKTQFIITNEYWDLNILSNKIYIYKAYKDPKPIKTLWINNLEATTSRLWA